ncbi:MAG: response regulator [Ignavibacteriaceae bacterium]|nr:response regulator [Ignavibacteriaceae bacterium]
MIEYKPKVLVVDDERALRTGVKRLLEMEDYEVTEAENGTEGIKLGTETEFDLAVIDLKMPDVDGIEVLKQIKKKFPHTVCYIATAYASYETAVEATRLGATGYIPKPFPPEELIQNLKEGYQTRLLYVEADKWRKEREERLLEVAFEKTRLNTIINSISDGVLVINKAGEAVLYNPAALKLLDLISIHIEEKIIGRLHPEIVGLINKILSKEEYQPSSYSSQIEMKLQGELFVEATASPVPHPDNSLAGVVVVIRNITALKKIEQLKSQFVSMVSHELKAPIAAVYGFLNLITDDKIKISNEQQKDYILRSQLRLDGLLKMVNDLLDISRMEMKTVRREIKQVCVEEIIKSVIELFQVEINKKGISVSLNCESDAACIKADYDEINRLFTNFISNAIKYNKENGSVSISISKSEDYLITEIKDTGIGLKPEEKKKLFSEFFRAKNELTKSISGTGLGLSIVKRIVDSYSGKIEVESEFGSGTTFRIFLPSSLKSV